MSHQPTSRVEVVITRPTLVLAALIVALGAVIAVLDAPFIMSARREEVSRARAALEGPAA